MCVTEQSNRVQTKTTGSDLEREQKCLANEVSILCTLQHENVIRVLAEVREEGSQVTQGFLMPCAAGGTIYDMLDEFEYVSLG